MRLGVPTGGGVFRPSTCEQVLNLMPLLWTGVICIGSQGSRLLTQWLIIASNLASRRGQRGDAALRPAGGQGHASQPSDCRSYTLPG